MDIHYMKVSQTDFRVYSSKEILQLSVKEINNPQTFDLLQNPVLGGLHDPLLGPSRRDDRCDSCGQSEMNCPGHMGHIKLPVLLYNPLLFKVLMKVLRGSCLSCHRIKFTLGQKQIYTGELQLLEQGFLSEAQTLVKSAKDGKFNVDKFVQDTLKDAVKGQDFMSKNKLTQIKNTVDDILKVMNAMSGSNCYHCQTQNRSLKQEYNTNIIGTKDKNETTRTPKEQIMKTSLPESTNETGPEEEVDMEGKGGPEAPQDKEPVCEDVPLSNDIQQEMDWFLQSKHSRCLLYPTVAREHLRKVWDYEKKFLCKVLPFLSKVSGADTPTDVFFLDIMPVPPTRFRPLSVMKERKYEHPQTANLATVLKTSQELKVLLKVYSERLKSGLQGTVQGPSLTEGPESMAAMMHKLASAWSRLQGNVNVVLDSDLDKISKEKCNGVKQLLEKKEGLFRMHMMGKRVNFAARSVISPDPYISTSEMGIPMVFASKLTYPQRVTPFNVNQLRKMVINGPEKYPGASSVIDEKGRVVRLNASNETQRIAIANQLLVPEDAGAVGCKTVCRHLINGDYLLLNRQPTLHRPSIQAHRARVLPNIKTLRMHYSNCKAYNADFDGDEMNAHFLQCELSRAEANQIVGCDHQYLSPRDGAPLAGLIQDHMVAGAALMIRGRFFTRKDYCNLVWSAMNDWKPKMNTVAPAIVKPTPMWSGKQIITTILLNIIPKDKKPLNLRSKSKIPEKSWTKWSGGRLMGRGAGGMEALGESTVLLSQGELLQGVLDKAQYGPASYGLVHCCYELYGGQIAGLLLTYLGRLFTSFLQMTGFSLGAGDILVTESANRKRSEFIKESLYLGRESAIKGLRLGDESISDPDLLLELKHAHFDKKGTRMAELDQSMKKETDMVQDKIAKCIMPGGLEKGFPDNSLQLMVQSGAKGSPVNCMQISCLLGQIELEGRRPPLMLSGRSLPSFLPHDVTPRAGGFVSGRFLTGINPQEYFFHCMAGREGLIDTAVKTSRSGYLQRCLVKHLEGIKVNYDLTVRDSDSSLVQFYYGEDGIEPALNCFLKPNLLPFLTQNGQLLISNCESSPWEKETSDKEVRHTWKKISKLKKSSEDKSFRENGFLEFCRSDKAPQITLSDQKTNLMKEETNQFYGCTKASKLLTQAWAALTLDQRASMCSIWSKKQCPDPLMAKQFPHARPDVMSEKFKHDLKVFLKKGFNQVADNMSDSVEADAFMLAVNKKLVRSMAQPGEGVGMVLAQSIGEPSTQMTLNTFHFAGRGEMNVTLGIPRLREILMTGSTNIKTPSMDIPLIHDGEGVRTQAEWLQRELTLVTLDQVLESLKVKISTKGHERDNVKLIEVKMKMIPARDYAKFTNLSGRAIMTYIVKKFLPRVNGNIKRKMEVLAKSTLLSQGKKRHKAVVDDDEDSTKRRKKDADDDDIEVEPNDGDMTAMREHQRLLDTQEYEGEDEERQAVTSESNEGEADLDATQAMPDGDETINQAISDGDSSSDEEAESKGEMIRGETNLLTAIKSAKKKEFVQDFTFSKSFKWCTIVFKYEQSSLQLDVRQIFEEAVKQAIVHRVRGVNRAVLAEVTRGGVTQVHLKTDGINIEEMFEYPHILDLNKLHCNCIHTMARTYGVEAAYKVIIREIQDVFGAYGIEVDYRHLSLLSDFMTCRGVYDAFNRRDIHYSTSPMQKMTFETTMAFLLDACVSGQADRLLSPSAQIVMGQPVTVGTGAFDILDPMTK